MRHTPGIAMHQALNGSSLYAPVSRALCQLQMVYLLFHLIIALQSHKCKFENLAAPCLERFPLGESEALKASPVSPKVSMEDVVGMLSSLYQKMKGEDSHAGRNKAPPEYGGAVEGGSLLDCKKKTSNGSSKGCCHTCKITCKFQMNSSWGWGRRCKGGG